MTEHSVFPSMARPLILNVGAGTETYGDIRVDWAPSQTTQVVCDADFGFPFRDSVFTEVYSRCVFEHLRNPGFFLDEAYRVLRPLGRLVLVTDHAAYWRWHFQIDHANAYTHRSSRDRHYGLFSPGHLANHCRAAGFELVSVGTIGFEEHVRLGKDRLLARLPRLRILAQPRIQLVAVKPVARVPRGSET